MEFQVCQEGSTDKGSSIGEQSPANDDTSRLFEDESEIDEEEDENAAVTTRTIITTTDQA